MILKSRFWCSFSGGLLLVLPGICQKRAESVWAVRVMRRYGK
ncbi:plasmid mobilization protein [Cronobacter sakazakii]|nr:plasmid mobilization protein [Cronobacter sakazakii]